MSTRQSLIGPGGLVEGRRVVVPSEEGRTPDRFGRTPRDPVEKLLVHDHRPLWDRGWRVNFLRLLRMTGLTPTPLRNVESHSPYTPTQVGPDHL